MPLKLTFLGTGSAFTVGNDNYQSSMLLQVNDDNLLIDAGTDIRFSLFDQGVNYQSINNVYISHLHGDHAGGLHWLALATYFDPNCHKRPCLYAAEEIMRDLWKKSLSAGLSTITDKKATLNTYFQAKALSGKREFRWQKILFKLVQMIHVYSDHALMPCFGLLFSYHNQTIFFTADTQFVPQQMMDFYQQADIIFHDCETNAFPSGVHAHYQDLVKLPAAIKAKMWLYHYNPGALPDAVKDGFRGFATKGQIFEFD